MKAIEELGRAGMAPDLSNLGGISDPVTGESIDTHRGSALSGLGNGTLSGTLGNRNSIFNEVAGGSEDSGSGGAPGGDNARGAMNAKKGMAMSGGSDNRTRDDTSVFGALTFGEAYLISLGQKDGVTYPGAGNRSATVHSGTSEDGTRIIFVRYMTDGEEDGTYYYEEGEEPREVPPKQDDDGGDSADNDDDEKPAPDDRPAPDDAGSSGGAMTAEQRKKAEQGLRNLVDPSVNPGSDGDGGTIAARGAGSGEVLTDTDLAGQPVDDETGGSRGAPPPVGPITTDVGLAGQPVGDDTNFGTLNPGSGGSLGVAGGFGSALVRGAAGTRVPTSVSDRVADDIGARVDPEN